MEQHFLSIEEFNEKLIQWNGQKVKISKHEIGDDDETIMDLKEITYSKDSRRLDDYEPMHALQLSGIGVVQTEDNNHEPLPTSIYEIPLENTTQYQFDGNQFSLKTDRGVYTIEVLH